MKWIEQRETVERNSGNENCQYPVEKYTRKRNTKNTLHVFERNWDDTRSRRIDVSIPKGLIIIQAGLNKLG